MQAKVLVADGEAQAIKLVNEAADLYFKGNAQTLRQLQAVETSLANNSKIVVRPIPRWLMSSADWQELTEPIYLRFCRQ